MRGEANDFPRLALALFQLQYENVPPYRAFCESQRVAPHAVETWADIPAVPTSAFKDFEFTSITSGQRTTVFCSSGTTEQRPSRHFHHGESLAVYEASLLAWAREHLPIESANLIFLTPDSAQAPHSSLVHMFDVISRHAPVRRFTFAGSVSGDGQWAINTSHLAALLKTCESAREPVGILGTAFGFVHVIDAVESARFALPAGSWLLETGGYKGRSRALPRSDLHRLLSDTFGVPADRVVTEYGMCELSSQAYDRSLVQHSGAEGVFRFPPWARTRVVSPETGRDVAEGEIGLIRVYDLANVYSVMAIETQDLARRRRGGFELIGRSADAERRGCSLMAP